MNDFCEYVVGCGKRKMTLLLFFVTLSLSLNARQDSATCQIVRIVPERLPDLNMPRSGHSTYYIEGEVVVIGGHTTNFVPASTSEYFDGEWHSLKMAYEHDGGFTVLLKSGKILIGGGHEKHLGIGQTFPVEFYDPQEHSFKGFGCLNKKRSITTAAEADSGRVLITGNWYAEDDMEVFDGKKQFTFLKNVSQQRARPYLFKTNNGDMLVLSAVDPRFSLYDTIVVDRMLGDSFHVPLFDEWKPKNILDNHDNSLSFIGDETKNSYAYLFPVTNAKGELSVAQVRDTLFSLLPVSNIPNESRWGKIQYFGSVVVDRNNQRGYLTGYDESHRLYVISIEYADTVGGKKAPVTMYYTDPLADVGFSSPVVNEQGDLIIAGGITDNNFEPYASVLMLPLGNHGRKTVSAWIWRIVAFAFLLTALVGAFLLLRRRTATNDVVENGTEDEDVAMLSYDANMLMQRIKDLMAEKELFLQPELKVIDVADALKVNSRYVSQCINLKEKTSFPMFINRYRVEYAKQLMAKSPHFTMVKIANDSGFLTDTSFFRVFRQLTGMTPKEWIAASHHDADGADQ